MVIIFLILVLANLLALKSGHSEDNRGPLGSEVKQMLIVRL